MRLPQLENGAEAGAVACQNVGARECLKYTAYVSLLPRRLPRPMAGLRRSGHGAALCMSAARVGGEGLVMRLAGNNNRYYKRMVPCIDGAVINSLASILYYRIAAFTRRRGSAII